MNMVYGAKAATVPHANALAGVPAGQCLADAPVETVEAVLRLIGDAQTALHSDNETETAIVRLTQAIDLLGRVGTSGPARTRFSGGLAGWQIRRLDSFIDRHIEATIRTPQLAAALNLSVGYFSHAFKQAMGMAPQAYVAHRRIELARQAMLTSCLSLAEIALGHGFCDQSHFSRTFRRETGLTPQKWRRVYDQSERLEHCGVAG